MTDHDSDAPDPSNSDGAVELIRTGEIEDPISIPSSVLERVDSGLARLVGNTSPALVYASALTAYDTIVSLDPSDRPGSVYFISPGTAYEIEVATIGSQDQDYTSRWITNGIRPGMLLASTEEEADVLLEGIKELERFKAENPGDTIRSNEFGGVDPDTPEETVVNLTSRLIVASILPGADSYRRPPQSNSYDFSAEVGLIDKRIFSFFDEERAGQRIRGTGIQGLEAKIKPLAQSIKPLIESGNPDAAQALMDTIAQQYVRPFFEQHRRSIALLAEMADQPDATKLALSALNHEDQSKRVGSGVTIRENPWAQYFKR